MMPESKISPRFWATVMIVVAIIGCLGTVIASIITEVPGFTLPALTSTPILIIGTETLIPTPIFIIVTETPIQPPISLTSGTYRVTVVSDVTFDTKWVLEVTGNQIVGTSEWSCCPQHRIDPMKGYIDGDKIVIERDCSSQNTSTCHQTYYGTMKNGVITGYFTADDIAWKTSWTLYLMP